MDSESKLLDEIELLKQKLEFADRTSTEAVERYFEQQKKIKELYKQIVDLETKLDKLTEKVKLETAKAIFTEMYGLVCDAEDYTIIVNANDIKSIAKRYGVKL